MDLVHHIVSTYAPSEILIGIGSAQASHTTRDPFTAGERFEMIDTALRFEKVTRFHIVPIADVDRHAVWVAHVASLVPAFEQAYSSDPLTKMLFGDAGYETPELPMFNRSAYEGKEIRRRMAAGEPWEEFVPLPARKLIEEMGGVRRLRTLSGSAEASRTLPGGDHAGKT
jgi:nicotinamide-nucleotide adenylyltransferase